MLMVINHIFIEGWKTNYDGYNKYINTGIISFKTTWFEFALQPQTSTYLSLAWFWKWYGFHACSFFRNQFWTSRYIYIYFTLCRTTQTKSKWRASVNISCVARDFKLDVFLVLYQLNVWPLPPNNKLSPVATLYWALSIFLPNLTSLPASDEEKHPCMMRPSCFNVTTVCGEWDLNLFFFTALLSSPVCFGL